MLTKARQFGPGGQPNANIAEKGEGKVCHMLTITDRGGKEGGSQLLTITDKGGRGDPDPPNMLTIFKNIS